jgi:hypothetical protein
MEQLRDETERFQRHVKILQGKISISNDAKYLAK